MRCSFFRSCPHVAYAILFLGPLCIATTPLSAFIHDPATVFINEIHYDNVGVDRNEAVEIAGPAGTDLSNWRLDLYNGGSGTDYFIQTLSDLIPDQGAGMGTVLIGLPTANFQNGAPDGLALVDAERQVVQLLFAWQENRNPFIDHPEWRWFISVRTTERARDR